MSASEAKLANIYEDEYKLIQQVGVTVQHRWNEVARTISIENVKDTASKVNEFSKWAEGQFEGIGFLAAVDTTPIYADRPPVISLLERVKVESEFDHEKKAAQVRRSLNG